MIFDVLPKGHRYRTHCQTIFRRKNKNGIPVRYTVKDISRFYSSTLKKRHAALGDAWHPTMYSIAVFIIVASFGLNLYFLRCQYITFLCDCQSFAEKFLSTIG